jgi:hypothetical protein
MRISAVVVAALFSAIVAGAACAQVPAKDAETFHGVTFPAEFAGSRRFSVEDYEKTNPGLGYSAGYRNNVGVVSTIYIYDLKLPNIPEDATAPAIKAQLEQASSDVRRAAQQGFYVNVERKADFAVEDRRRRQRFACASFTLVLKDDSRTRDSFLCLGGVKGKFFKIRITTVQHADTMPDARRFVAAWAEYLWPQ